MVPAEGPVVAAASLLKEASGCAAQEDAETLSRRIRGDPASRNRGSFDGAAPEGNWQMIGVGISQQKCVSAIGRYGSPLPELSPWTAKDMSFPAVTPAEIPGPCLAELSNLLNSQPMAQCGSATRRPASQLSRRRSPSTSTSPSGAWLPAPGTAPVVDTPL